MPAAAAREAAAGIGAGAGRARSRGGVGEGGARLRVRGGARPGSPPPTPAARGLRPPCAAVWSRSRRWVAAPGTWRRTHLPAPECSDSPLSALLLSPPRCRREAPPSLPSRERGRAGRAGPGWSSGCGGGRGSLACSEGLAEARGREGGEGSAALPPPPLAGKRWRRSGEPGDSSAPPPSGSAACCCSSAGRRAPRPPGAAPRRSSQVSGGRGVRDREARGGGGGAAPAPAAAAAVFLFRIQEETCRNFSASSRVAEEKGGRAG